MDISSATTSTPGTVLLKLSSTSLTSLLDNAAASGEIILVTSIIITNEDTANTTYITLERYSQDALGGTAYPILKQQDIVPGVPFQVLEHGIWLDEDKSLGVTAEAANDMVIQVDYVVFA